MCPYNNRIFLYDPNASYDTIGVNYRRLLKQPKDDAMKRPLKVYPKHKCISCHRETNNKNYCDFHLAIYMKPPYGTFSDPTRISAEKGTHAVKRYESSDTI